MSEQKQEETQLEHRAASATVERAAVTTEASQATEQTRSQQAEIAKKERDRIAAINTSCRAAKLPQSFSDQLINDSVPQEQAMQRIVEELQFTVWSAFQQIQQSKSLDSSENS